MSELSFKKAACKNIWPQVCRHFRSTPRNSSEDCFRGRGAGLDTLPCATRNQLLSYFTSQNKPRAQSICANAALETPP